MKCWRDFGLGNINKAQRKTQASSRKEAEQIERMETFDASDSVDPGADEDSVDIYEGLDAAGVGSNTEKWPSVGSGLKDSLDLYEDIVAEEQNNRETSYTELKSRFEATQNQIKELHRRLQQMETQNTGLSSENNRLKKNISALLRTARQEIIRKDAEIKQLTQQVQKFHHHHHHHQPQLKQAQDPRSSFRASSSCSSTRTLPLPSSLPIVPRPHHHPPHFAPLISSQFEEEPPPADTPQPTSKETCHFSRSMKSSTHNCSKRHETAEKLPGVEGCTSRDREVKGQSNKLPESAERKLRDCSHHNKDSEQKQAHKEDKDTRKGFDSQSHKNKKYQNVGRHCRSDGAKTSSQEHLHSVASSEHRREGRKIQRTDKASSIEHAKVSDQQSGGSCSPESRKIPRGHKYDSWSNPKNKRSSSPDQSTKCCSDGSRERERSRQRDHQRSVDRRCEDEIRSRHHRRSSQKESSRDREKHRDKQTGKADGSKEGRRETKPRDVKRSFEEPSPEANTSVNDNNSNRKLCFMETLNLTLSPIKKYTTPRDSSLEEPLRLEGDDEENSQPNLDNMCVIDEVDGGELGSEPGPGHAEEQALEELKAPRNQTSNLEDVEEDGNNGAESQGRPLAVLISSLWRPPQGPADTTKLHTAAGENLKHPEEPLELISNTWITERGQLEVTKSSQPSNTNPQILEQHSSSEAPTSEVQHAAAADEHADPHAHAAQHEHDAAADEHAAADSGEAPAPPRLSQSTVSEAAASAQPDDTHGTEEVYEEARLRDRWGHQAASPGTSLPSSTSVTMDNHPVGQPQSYKDLDSVSSTICLTSLPQKGLSLTEDICAMTQTDTDPRTSSSQPSSSVDCIGVSKVSRTTEEFSPATVTPKKFCSQDCKKELSTSVSLPHDEDSMMHTLSNLKRIPEVISPLRSPAQTAKRGVLHVHSKLGHVKSLQKEFSTSAAETNLMKLDVNKENKYPGSPANRGAQDMVNMESEQISSPFDTELEEGEILSESDEATSSSPVPATKRAKLTEPVRNKPSLQSSSRRKPEEQRVASKEPLDSAAVSTQSPRSRFKTVCPSASKASFSTVEEIMETFKMVRTEMRKKYMKLHKTFPKKSFWGVMDNFQKSFLEFVDGAHFGQICSDAEELKSKLRKLITSVFSKVLNNGIVKRIFEQQAVNLKQKLWDFVDVQVDYLLMDIQTTLKSLCQAVRIPTEDKRPGGQGTEPQQASVKKPLCKQNKSHPPNSSLGRTKSCAVVPYRTGLGSRGKDIRMSFTEKDGASHIHPPGRVNTQTTVNFLSDSNAALSPDKTKMVIPQNGSVIDRTDFELLTEQQASSLTFNLVRDSQMGEIFKCLLQGSDLLESTGMCGDNTAWAVGTPRKDGERFLNFATPSKFLSPSKSDTSARLIATWSTISPRRRSSPCIKTPIPLHPALFDESCLLEVPSGNRALLQGSLATEKYSILAEDLAVSLTIPSPLKSDSHLSFLQPAGVGIHVVSTPDSVISAHISEDALLDGEDATEQDIHLALDNSSCSSRDSTTSQTPGSTLFFKPDVPMQALVMEKSNDHFIVKIRQMNAAAEGTLIAGEPLRQTLIEKNQQHEEDDAQERLKVAGQTENSTENPTSGSHTHEQRWTPGTNPSNPRQDTSTQSGKTTPETDPSDPSSNISSSTSHSTLVPHPSRTQLQVEATPPKSFPFQSQKQTSPPSATLSPNTKTPFYDSGREETTVSESEKSLTIDTSSSSEKTSRDCEQLRKRKRRQEKLKAKRCKKEDKSLQEVSPSRKSDEELKLSPAALSPSSLSAKNIIRKKGEVVMAWTRDEDRAILMFLKTKGASRETFSTLSEKLNKPSGQIAHRFYQLMKLFKKQGKMDI
ncbi:CASP8-associated protein 2 isoform X3 [Xiphophorus maculatus]|uniref:CASP8-associated protein 2 isoform X2 n=1 Tax=Xiphophorus maculatus TaxID=8083 RepID=UPI000C6ED3C5|nr:CASP8-associated protein 2 isoform X2 [Xiphophorus maculatus]XP_023203736.1 CASP8-associated protein 2 isoform X3 [Xiphophorus maculatus]